MATVDELVRAFGPRFAELCAAARAGCPGLALDDAALVAALTDAERALVEQHLDGCSACAQAITELARSIAPPRAAPAGYHIVGAAGDAWIADDLTSGGRVELRFVTAPAPAHAELLRRARAAAEVHHPNLASIEDAGELGDEVYIASELPLGVSMRAWLETGPDRREIIAVWRAAVDAAAALHRAGASHGALSPDHIRIYAGGLVQLSGFGAAQPLAYQAVELLHGGPPSPRADQFALCVTLWEALTGEPPFSGATAGALAVAMTAPLALPHHDRVFFGTLWRGLAPDPARRWRDLRELLAAIDGRRNRRRAWIAVGTVIAASAWEILRGLLFF